MKLKQILTMTFDDREKVLELLPHKVQVIFAIYCAELVQHLDTSVEGPKALATAKAWLEGKATKEQCKKAADDAYAVAYASASASTYSVTSAYASASSTSASTSAASVYDTAYASSSAAYYASAVYTATTNNVKMVKYLQLLCLQEFHKENKLIRLLFNL